MACQIRVRDASCQIRAYQVRARVELNVAAHVEDLAVDAHGGREDAEVDVQVGQEAKAGVVAALLDGERLEAGARERVLDRLDHARGAVRGHRRDVGVAEVERGVAEGAESRGAAEVVRAEGVLDDRVGGVGLEGAELVDVRDERELGDDDERLDRAHVVEANPVRVRAWTGGAAAGGRWPEGGIGNVGVK